MNDCPYADQDKVWNRNEQESLPISIRDWTPDDSWLWRQIPKHDLQRLAVATEVYATGHLRRILEIPTDQVTGCETRLLQLTGLMKSPMPDCKDFPRMPSTIPDAEDFPMPLCGNDMAFLASPRRSKLELLALMVHLQGQRNPPAEHIALAAHEFLEGSQDDEGTPYPRTLVRVGMDVIGRLKEAPPKDRDELAVLNSLRSSQTQLPSPNNSEERINRLSSVLQVAVSLRQAVTEPHPETLSRTHAAILMLGHAWARYSLTSTVPRTYWHSVDTLVRQLVTQGNLSLEDAVELYALFGVYDWKSLPSPQTTDQATAVLNALRKVPLSEETGIKSAINFLHSGSPEARNALDSIADGYLRPGCRGGYWQDHARHLRPTKSFHSDLWPNVSSLTLLDDEARCRNNPASLTPCHPVEDLIQRRRNEDHLRGLQLQSPELFKNVCCSLLIPAIRGKHTETVDYLLKAGAPVNIRRDGTTPLSVAGTTEQYTLYSTLLKTLRAQSPDHAAFEAQALVDLVYNPEALLQLVRAGASTGRDLFGRIPLQQAVRRSLYSEPDSQQAFQILFSASDPLAPDAHGDTIFHLADTPHLLPSGALAVLVQNRRDALLRTLSSTNCDGAITRIARSIALESKASSDNQSNARIKHQPPISWRKILLASGMSNDEINSILAQLDVPLHRPSRESYLRLLRGICGCFCARSGLKGPL